jgi:hypothetical protein
MAVLTANDLKTKGVSDIEHLLQAGQLQRLKWDRVVDDVRPLLDVGADSALLTLENVLPVVAYPRSEQGVGCGGSPIVS